MPRTWTNGSARNTSRSTSTHGRKPWARRAVARSKRTSNAAVRPADDPSTDRPRSRPLSDLHEWDRHDGVGFEGNARPRQTHAEPEEDPLRRFLEMGTPAKRHRQWHRRT